MSKYYNVKTTTSDGIRHDSAKEAQRWCELKLLERMGAIQNLKRQVEFELIPNQYETVKGKQKLVERKCSYIADFTYIENGELVVEDTKSDITKTPAFVIKRKLMLKVHGIKVKTL